MAILVLQHLFGIHLDHYLNILRLHYQVNLEVEEMMLSYHYRLSIKVISYISKMGFQIWLQPLIY